MPKDEPKKIEIDMENLIVQVKRGVILGELDEFVRSRGLMFAPYTPDMHYLTIEEMYAGQIGSLTGQKYGLPKFHVMGLEVILADGQVLKTGGKTVKNVTGYDLTRLFLSSRESIGLPVSFILKLMPLEETCVFCLLNMPSLDQFQKFLNKINQEKILPAVSCFWDIPEIKPIEVFLGFTGIEEKVAQDIKILREIVREINVDLSLLEERALIKNWEMISGLRKKSSWYNCYKIMPDRLGQLLEAFYSSGVASLGLWGNPTQGSISIMLPEKDISEKTYQNLARIVKELGGATNWYYDRQYNMENPALRKIAEKLKGAFGGGF